jgi:hypothetical protein
MAAGQFASVQAPVTIVHSNLDQEVIQITEDRLRLVLNDHLRRAEDRKSWVAPFGIFLAIITAFVTADFRDFGLKAAVWQAIFILCGVASLIWLLRSSYLGYTSPTVENIISKVKRAENCATPPAK